jgi:hypothetical protein
MSQTASTFTRSLFVILLKVFMFFLLVLSQQPHFPPLVFHPHSISIFTILLCRLSEFPSPPISILNTIWCLSWDTMKIELYSCSPYGCGHSYSEPHTDCGLIATPNVISRFSNVLKEPTSFLVPGLCEERTCAVICSSSVTAGFFVKSSHSVRLRQHSAVNLLLFYAGLCCISAGSVIQREVAGTGPISAWQSLEWSIIDEPVIKHRQFRNQVCDPLPALNKDFALSWKVYGSISDRCQISKLRCFFSQFLQLNADRVPVPQNVPWRLLCYLLCFIIREHTSFPTDCTSFSWYSIVK